nr:MAG TPA: hypothetical protein [Bacteriophage sp.]DAT11874.1 MAG TPA: hypothetical protein [Herelleviridae sp.]
MAQPVSLCNLSNCVPVLARISNINTGFWLKILLEIQGIINEIANSKLIDVIIYQTQIILYLLN